jgi:hypothetical protein
MKKGVSEIIGQAVFGDGSKAAAYRALRPLVCASCGARVEGGEMFTRASLAGQSLRLWPRCQACLPFALVSAESGSGATRSSLIKFLLTPAEAGPATALTEDEKERATSKEKNANDERRKALVAMRRRLGPALERARRSRFGNK